MSNKQAGPRNHLDMKQTSNWLPSSLDHGLTSTQPYHQLRRSRATFIQDGHPDGGFLRSRPPLLSLWSSPRAHLSLSGGTLFPTPHTCRKLVTRPGSSIFQGILCLKFNDAPLHSQTSTRAHYETHTGKY